MLIKKVEEIKEKEEVIGCEATLDYDGDEYVEFFAGPGWLDEVDGEQRIIKKLKEDIPKLKEKRVDLYEGKSKKKVSGFKGKVI